MTKSKPSICIVAHNAYGVLANVDTGHVGGIEVQTPLLAKWLVKNGFDVSMITWDEGYPDGTVVEGVKLYKLCRRGDGLPLLRFIFPRWWSLIQALKRANADIVYYNCGDLALGQIVLWAKMNGKKAVYTVANEADCQRELRGLVPLRERVLYRYGLLNVGKIIVQTEKQKSLLQSDFNRPSMVIPMPCEGFNHDLDLMAKSRNIKEGFRVLWVGRFSTEKRLELLLDVAEKLPEIEFDVLGDANLNTEYARSLKDRAEKISNVKLHGRVSRDLIGNYYRSASVICSTSIYEGFPNVYLEAWSTGLPIVCTFDPDGVVSRHKLGKIVDNVDELVDAIVKLKDERQWYATACAARKYYETFHKVDACMEKFAQEFVNLHSVK